MSEDQFNQLVNDTCETIKQVLIVKGKEYRRNSNVFHNFEKGAEISGNTREQVLAGFALKHQISIMDMRNDLDKEIIPEIETVEEKFNDAIVYLFLEKACYVDRIKYNDPF